jgi:hypothetical protein
MNAWGKIDRREEAQRVRVWFFLLGLFLSISLSDTQVREGGRVFLIC